MNLSHYAFLAGFCVYVGIRAFYKQRTKANQIAVGRMDFIEKALLILLIPGALLFPLAYLFTRWLGFADYRLPMGADLGGLLLMAAALYLFWRSHADLGENWSQTLELRKGHELVTHGVYRSIRHPMYASLWLWFVAQSLVLQNWLAGLFPLVAFALMYFIRTPREEQMMREHFGEQYVDYMQRTGRIFPSRKRLKPRVSLYPHTPEHLRALLDGRDVYETRVGLKVADGVRELLIGPEVSAGFLTRLNSASEPDPWKDGFGVLHLAHNTIIGFCSFTGAPTAEGMVEIAYGIAPVYQQRGYATEAAQALIDYAFATGRVRTIKAHTLPEHNASTRVLVKCGFTLSEEIIHPEDGPVWRWERKGK